MAQVSKNDNRFGGEYMIQDRDHMSEVSEVSNDEKNTRVRQPEQSQAQTRQQGGDQSSVGQQSGEWQHMTR